MKNLLTILLLTPLMFSCSAPTTEPPSSAVVRPASSNSSVSNGLALYKAYKVKANRKETPQVASARSKISNFCPGRYIPVTLPNNPKVVYFILTTSSDNVAFGRHFKVQGNQVTSSTKSCLTIPKKAPSGETVAVMTSHLGSDYPTEFHVFLSLLHNVAIGVAAPNSTWFVNGTKIEKL